MTIVATDHRQPCIRDPNISYYSPFHHYLCIHIKNMNMVEIIIVVINNR